MTTATIQKFEHRNISPSSASSIDGPPSEASEPSRAGSSHSNSSFSYSHSASLSPISPKVLSASPSREHGPNGERDTRCRKQTSLTEISLLKGRPRYNLSPSLLAMPIEDRAFCYFANRYALAPTQYLDPGYLPVLKVVSQRKSLGPCLSSCLSAVSLAAFSTKTNARKSVLRARSAYATALQMTNEAIRRPGSCNDDELLASVVLLALFEVDAQIQLDLAYIMLI